MGTRDQDMEKLEILLQEMVVRRFGKKCWHSILQRSVALCDFEQHVESYGAQRVATREEIPPGPGCGQASSAGSPLLDSAAELLGMTVCGLLEELGGHYASSLRRGVSPPRPFTSEADYFSAAAFYYNSCSWILEAIVPGSLQVTATAGGWLKIQCALRENCLWAFLTGFLSKILAGVDGPVEVSHAETTTLRGVPLHSFVLRNGAAIEPEHRTDCLTLVT